MDWEPGAEKGEEERNPFAARCEGEVPGEIPLRARAGDALDVARGGEPMGPKSRDGLRGDWEGGLRADIGRDTGDADLETFSMLGSALIASTLGASSFLGVVSGDPDNDFLSSFPSNLSSNRDAKSVSLRPGAGADARAFDGSVIGGLPAGALPPDPEASKGLRGASRRLFPRPPFAPPSLPPDAACCAAFLFFLSIAML